MKLLGKTRDEASDGAMESLLRAYVSRPTNRACSEFDADLANAYIERNLTTASRSGYEQHLSECAPCRKNVIELSRLAESELQASISARAGAGGGGRKLFGVTAWPRWAMAAAAVIVIAISLPLILTRNDSHPADAALATNAGQAAENSSQGSESQAPASTPLAKVAAASSEGNAEPKSSERLRDDAVTSNGPAQAQQPGGSGGDKASTNSLESKAESTPAVDQVQPAAGAQPAPSEVATGQTRQEKQSETAGFVSARQQQPSKDGAAAKTNSEDSVKKEQVAESAAAIPPPAPPSAKPDNKSDNKSDKLKRPSAMRALRDSSPSEAVRLTERQVGNKKFLLKNDTWTDRRYKPDDDLPIVTVVRDSNVYNELLNKQAGLKTYLAGFTGTERAIIVYKGTVYKLIPQQSDK